MSSQPNIELISLFFQIQSEMCHPSKGQISYALKCCSDANKLHYKACKEMKRHKSVLYGSVFAHTLLVRRMRGWQGGMNNPLSI